MTEETHHFRKGDGDMTLAISVVIAALLVSAAVFLSVGGVSGELRNLSGEVAGIKARLSGTAGTGTIGAGTQPTEPIQAPQGRVAIDVSGRPVLGNPSAPVQIVEFSDFECPFCSRALPTVKQVMAQYGNSVNLVYMHFPLEQIHPRARPAAVAFECVLQQDLNKAWAYHDKLFENQAALDDASLKRYATDVGADAAAFNTCYDGRATNAQVDADLNKGLQAGVTGTPTFFINGVRLVGAQPLAAFQSVIDAELAR